MVSAVAFAFALLFGKSLGGAFPDCVRGPLRNTTVCDPSASPLDRATALVSLFTTAEKLNNTGNTSPGVPRLGLYDYEWWNEALHGVASSGNRDGFMNETGDFSYATSFPQPILMGASFNDDLIFRVASAISTEARAFNNDGRGGIDYWTPNINPFRDPRWGRGQETPGEDVFHLKSYVKALIAGFQGGVDPKYKKIIATCKHYAGYDMENWNGNHRYHFDAQISTQDLVEYYLPTFETCARDAKVGAVMCSYNALNGVPTCADPYLLDTILRQHWNWTSEQQWVTSDCDAVQNIFLPHEYTKTREEAVAAALIAGTDVDCGAYYPIYLPGAYEKGLINDTVIDRALIRQYSSLIQAGYFDPPEDQPYRALSWADVATPETEQLAYEAAVEGIVLLKNDGILPLTLDSSVSIGLIGEWANATKQLLGNYHGTPPFYHGPLWAAQQLNYTVNYDSGPGGSADPTTGNWRTMYEAAEKSDIIIYISGIDNDIEKEDGDRHDISWSGGQLDAITSLADYGKPMVVVQMGGGQLDDTPLLEHPNINAIVWAGYPGQDGGVAIFDILTGKRAPAGRLPLTQYPSKYAAEIPMTDMNLRPTGDFPGRTYRWYTGEAVVEFGTGLHYTEFKASAQAPKNSSYSIASLGSGCSESYLDLCPFETFPVSVSNTGSTISSDYVTLGFLKSNAGPGPYPKKTLVAYQRLFDVTPGTSQTASLNLTLGSLARVDEKGNKVIYPGDYTLLIDTQPLAEVDFTLYGEPRTIENWPQPPQRGDPYDSGYFVGGYGSQEVAHS